MMIMGWCEIATGKYDVRAQRVSENNDQVSTIRINKLTIIDSESRDTLRIIDKLIVDTEIEGLWFISYNM